MPNQTITAEEEVLRWARVRAAEENTSQFVYLIPSEYIPSENGLFKNFSLTGKYTTFIVDLPVPSGKDPTRTTDQVIFTELEKRRIEQLYLSGETIVSISVIMGIKEGHVKWLIDHSDIKRPHHLTTDTRKQIIEMYQSGSSMNDIVKETMFSSTTIKQVLREDGIHHRRALIIMPEWKKEILKMYNSGMTPNEISRHYGLSRSNAISSFIHKNKWLEKIGALQLRANSE